MARSLLSYRIFFASPGGLDAERKLFRRVIEQYNASDAMERGAHFVAVGWEDTLSTIGRPQAVINEQVRSCDFFVMVLWDRWGSPPSVGSGPYTSGTQEEYFVARRCVACPDNPMRDLAVFFKGVDARKLSDPGPQLQAVLKFRRELEESRSVLFKSFEEHPDFEHQLRLLLACWLRSHETSLSQPSALVAQVRESGESRSFTAKAEVSTFATESLELSRTGEGPFHETVRNLIFEERLLDAELMFAEELSRRADDLQVLTAWGRFLAATNRSTQARKVLKRVLKRCPPQDYSIRSAALAALGVAYLNVNRPKEGLVVLERARLLYKAVDDAEGVAWTTGNLALAKQELTDYPAARELYRTAIELERSLGRVGLGLLGKDLHNFAAMELNQGNLDPAEQLLNEALAVNQANGFRRYLGETYLTLADLHDIRQICTERPEAWQPTAEAKRYRKLAEEVERILAADRSASRAVRKKMANIQMLDSGQLQLDSIPDAP